MTLNMGPQHPSTHGVLRVVLELDGETIVKAKPIIGYLHTGMEKQAEYKTYTQSIPQTDRMDYLAPMSMACVPIHTACELMRVSSVSSTRIACTRAGGSMPSSFSAARQNARLFDIGEM